MKEFRFHPYIKIQYAFINYKVNNNTDNFISGCLVTIQITCTYDFNYLNTSQFYYHIVI